jgi:phosphoenolpyruvate synthase/pyruvate phosphate dikinase
MHRRDPEISQGLVFADLRNTDVPEVGGKTVSVGELYSMLSHEGIRVPNGFTLTAHAYRDALLSAHGTNSERCCRVSSIAMSQRSLSARAR